MTVKTARCVACLAVVAIAAILAACEVGEKANLPVGPSAVVRITNFEIAGPATVPPGGTAGFTATASMSDGTVRDVTAEALWHTSSPSTLSIDAAGRATASAPGETQVMADFRTRRSTREVIVVPTGTYRLAGIVTESNFSDAGLVDALVEVTAGTGTGLLTRTGNGGRYRLYGVAGDTQIRVTKDGYQPRMLGVAVTDHQVQDVDLEPARPRADVSGVYALTITAADSCRSVLPEEARTRTYTAHLTQAGPHVDVRLSGASFVVVPSGRGDHFRGRFEQDSVSFSLNPHAYKYYGYAQYPDVAEKLPSGIGFFVVSGSVVVRSTPTGLSGTLEGAFSFFKSDPAWGGMSSADCAGGHAFVFVRIAGEAR